MFDHEFTKYEIATYLKEFDKLLFYASGETNKTFFQIFKKVLERDFKRQYVIASHYNEMIDIYEIVLLTKFLIQTYDNYFQYLEEDAIEKLNISTDFVLTTKKITKKQVIKGLIEGFKNPNSYRIVRVDEDGRTKIKIEVLYNNDRKELFHAIVNIPTLSRMLKELLKANKATDISSIRLGTSKKIEDGKEKRESYYYFRKYYMTDAMSKKNKQNLLEKINSGDLDNLTTDEIDLVFLQNGMDYEDYYHSKEQIAKASQDMIYWTRMNNLGYNVEGFKPINHVLEKTMPFSCLKTNPLFMNYILVDNYLSDFDNSLIKISEDIKKLEKESSPLSPFDLYRKIFKKDRLDPEYLDLENILAITSSIYYGYVFENLVETDTVILAGREVKRENVVNAFNNMTWSISENESYSLHDYTDMYQTNEVLNINLGFEELAESIDIYYKDAISKVDDDTFMDLPIHFMSQRLSNGMNKVIGISCIKNKKYYFYNIFNDLLVISDGKEINRYATSEELDIFIHELDNLSEAEKKDYKDQLEEIRNILMEEILFIESGKSPIKKQC